jgi:hypothetical protein
MVSIDRAGCHDPFKQLKAVALQRRFKGCAIHFISPWRKPDRIG